MHTKGNWTVSEISAHAVVTDSAPEFGNTNSGHLDKEFYGGFLIAESILRNEDAKLIAAAPDLLSALKKAIDYLPFGSLKHECYRAIQKAEY